MWDAIKGVLTDTNTWQVLLFLVFMVTVIIIAGKKGLLSVKAKGIRLGTDETERNIIRQQTEWAYLYIMSLQSKIETDGAYNGYFTKYILERIYDKTVAWITFNHLHTKNAYIEIKQEEVCALVYSLGVKDEFKTPEFKKRMCNWVRELIEHLVQIREIYNNK